MKRRSVEKKKGGGGGSSGRKERNGKMVNGKKDEKEADEGREVVSLTHYRLIKLEYSPLPVRVWSCSAALSETALFLQSIAP